MLYNNLLLIISKSSILVGGQAIIEGVMMRVPGAYASSVRDLSGKIISKRVEFVSIVDKYKFLKIPVLRGIIGLFEALKIGLETLQWSASLAEPNYKENKHNYLDSILTIISFGVAISIFVIVPLTLTSWISHKDLDPIIFNLLSGLFRISFFLIYLFLISMMKDVKTLFQYHGAEHKAVFTFEAGKSLTINNTYDFPTQHPRCGTSFLFIIMIVAIISFAALDSIIILMWGEINLSTRLISHIPFMPIVMGFGYEVLKLTAKYNNFLVFKLLSKPGLLLQNITTKIPSDKQVEVALEALKCAFNYDVSKYEGKKHVAEAIG